MTITIQFWWLPLAVYWLVILGLSLSVTFEEQSIFPGVALASVFGVPATIVALLTRFL